MTAIYRFARGCAAHRSAIRPSNLTSVPANRSKQFESRQVSEGGEHRADRQTGRPVCRVWALRWQGASAGLDCDVAQWPRARASSSARVREHVFCSRPRAETLTLVPRKCFGPGSWPTLTTRVTNCHETPPAGCRPQTTRRGTVNLSVCHAGRQTDRQTEIQTRGKESQDGPK